MIFILYFWFFSFLGGIEAFSNTTNHTATFHQAHFCSHQGCSHTQSSCSSALVATVELEETDTDDDTNEDTSFLHLSTQLPTEKVPNATFSLYSLRLHQYSLFIENLPGVPLFVLHHAWRSFLC
ncbi:MAG: hypothetical protein ACK4GN_03570 [Runella sp.]